MYKNRRILLIVPAYNEELKIGEVIRRYPRRVVDTVLVIDDGSTDGTAQVARQAGAEVISLGSVKGVGFAIRTGYTVARERRFDVAVTISGNNKDNPDEIPRLLDPICEDGREFVIGSRFLAGGGYGGDMPSYRKIATRLHPLLVSFFSGQSITESTNGFRALKVSMLDDPRINLEQAWLDHYELEVYLLMKVLKLGHPFTQVPVTKVYPPRQIGYTKMRPFLDWWKLLKPIFIVGLGLN
jgi:dolichol-phosphate mannosyltransferase